MAATEYSEVRLPQCTIPAPLTRYVRHRPEDAMLHAVVDEHIEAFYREPGERGGGRSTVPQSDPVPDDGLAQVQSGTRARRMPRARPRAAN